MRLLEVTAGVLMVLGGAPPLVSMAKGSGQTPSRGDLLGGTAFAGFGLLLLSGLVLTGTMVGAVITWVFAIAASAAMWLIRRDPRQR